MKATNLVATAVMAGALIMLCVKMQSHDAQQSVAALHASSEYVIPLPRSTSLEVTSSMLFVPMAERAKPEVRKAASKTAIHSATPSPLPHKAEGEPNNTPVRLRKRDRIPQERSLTQFIHEQMKHPTSTDQGIKKDSRGFIWNKKYRIFLPPGGERDPPELLPNLDLPRRSSERLKPVRWSSEREESYIRDANVSKFLRQRHRPAPMYKNIFGDCMRNGSCIDEDQWWMWPNGRIDPESIDDIYYRVWYSVNQPITLDIKGYRKHTLWNRTDQQQLRYKLALERESQDHSESKRQHTEPKPVTSILHGEAEMKESTLQLRTVSCTEELGTCVRNWVAAHAERLFPVHGVPTMSVFNYGERENSDFSLASRLPPAWTIATAALPTTPMGLCRNYTLHLLQLDIPNLIILAPTTLHRVYALSTVTELFGVQIWLPYEELTALVKRDHLVPGLMLGVARQTLVMFGCDIADDARLINASIAAVIGKKFAVGPRSFRVTMEVVARFDGPKCVKPLLLVTVEYIRKGTRDGYCSEDIHTPKYDIVYTRGSFPRLWLSKDPVAQPTTERKILSKFIPSINMATVLGWGISNWTRQLLLYRSVARPLERDAMPHNWLLTLGAQPLRIDHDTPHHCTEGPAYILENFLYPFGFTRWEDLVVPQCSNSRWCTQRYEKYCWEWSPPECFQGLVQCFEANRKMAQTPDTYPSITQSQLQLGSPRLQCHPRHSLGR